mgnify:CR=1 FL=1
MKHLSISLSSQKGLVRPHNEDMLLVCTETYRDAEAQREVDITETSSVIMAVADGMGGHNAGEVASEDAARELGNHISVMSRVLSQRELREELEQWIQDEHTYLTEQGEENPAQQGMGTTLVAVLCYRERFYAINCGDSRLYLMHDGSLRQLSRDHSLYAVTHRESDRHIITNCLGGGGDESFIDYDDITDELQPGDRLLLCSDGLTDMVSDEDLEQLLADPQTMAADFINAAYQAGGEDNVSVIVITAT